MWFGKELSLAWNFVSQGELLCNFEIVGYCNAKCVFCSYPQVSAREALSLEDGKRAIDKLRRLGVRVLNLTGGEPFLNKSIVDLLAYGTQAGLLMNTGTNGSLITEELAERIGKAGLRAMWISIEG